MITNVTGDMRVDQRDFSYLFYIFSHEKTTCFHP